MEKTHLQAAEEFWLQTKPRDESVLVPLISAIKFLLDQGASVKAIHQFVLSRDVQCSYSTILQFVNRYLSSPEARKKKKLSALFNEDYGTESSGPSETAIQAGKREALNKQIDAPLEQLSKGKKTNLARKIAQGRAKLDNDFAKSSFAEAKLE